MLNITELAAVTAAALVVSGAPVSTEFSDPGSLAAWSASTGEIQDGGRTAWSVEGGRLVVHVAQSSWLNAEHAFYLWQTVDGDFDVSARVRATGEHGAVPTGDWSLTGLLVRDPAAAGTAHEQWIGWTTGRVGGRPVFERKSTVNGGSPLVLVPAKAGWVDLRVVRRGTTFSLYRRYPHKKWVAIWRYQRPELGETLQVGVDAQTGFRSHADLVALVDWVRFAAP